MSDGEEREAASQLVRKQATAHGSILKDRYPVLSLFAMVQGQILAGAKLMAESDAVGGHSEVTAEVCQPAAGCARLCQRCSER